MDIQKRLSQINIQKAIKSDMKTDLLDILKSISKERLSSLASIYKIPRRSKMKKEMLAERLLESVTNDERLEAALLISTPMEWDLFGTLLNKPFIQDNSITPGTYSYLMDKGLIFSFFSGDKLYFVMPDEVKHTYSKVDISSFMKTRDRYQSVAQYVMALTSLYGAFKSDTLIDIFNSQNSRKLNLNEFTKIFYCFTNRIQLFSMYKGYIISDYFAFGSTDELEELEELIENTKSKPYYIPDKSQLLKYSDDLYFEMTPQLVDLKAFILKNMCSDKELVGYLVDDVQMKCTMEAPLQEIIQEFERRNIHFKSQDQLRTVMSMIMEVHNHTRLWSNRGHTPTELSKLSGESIPRTGYKPIQLGQISVEKIGRNAPCPCGSGKKYKKCCGK